MEVDQLTEWLWCLRTPLVHEVLLTHGHDDHTGAAAGLRARTGGVLVASREEAGVIARERSAPPPQLADREVPLFEQVTPNVPEAPPAVPDRLAVPGHTPGQVAAWFEADACSSPATPWPPTMDGRWSACSTPIPRSPSRRRASSRASMSRSPGSGTANRFAVTLPKIEEAFAP